MQLSNNTVLITGGGTGIGRGLAVALAQRGNTVLICGRRETPLKETAAQHKDIHYYVCDLSQRPAVEALCQKLQADGHALNVLINNAGINNDYHFHKPESVDLDAAECEIATNLNAPLILSMKLLPLMLQQPNPVIINVSSPGGIVAVAPMAIYSASKAALHALTQSLRYQLQGKVEVVEVFPPTVATEMTSDLARHKVSVDSCVTAILKGLERGKAEIWIGEGKVLKWLNYLLPAHVFTLVNNQPSIKNRLK